MLNLERVKIVLVDTRYGGNIGSAARAMANMGMKRLVLVRPQSFPSKEASLLAAKAQHILQSAQVCDSLNEALAEEDLVIGTSSRHRRFPIPTYSVKDAVGRLTADHKGNIAVVFGSEDKGLTNEELESCSFHLFIPANTDYPVLNLAAAVQIFCYELFCALNGQDDSMESSFHSSSRLRPYANNAELENFYDHLTEWVREVKFFNPQNPATVIRKLRNIFTRARLRANEVKMLRGLITHSIKLVKRRKEDVHYP